MKEGASLTTPHIVLLLQDSRKPHQLLSNDLRKVLDEIRKSPLHLPEAGYSQI
jgi:hypothetical protein